MVPLKSTSREESHIAIEAQGFQPSTALSFLRNRGDRVLRAPQVLASPLQRRLTQAAHQGEELVFWDPFCGSGAAQLHMIRSEIGTDWPSFLGKAWRVVRVWVSEDITL